MQNQKVTPPLSPPAIARGDEKVKVVISAGHTNQWPGACYHGLREHDEARKVCDLLEGMLSETGYRVFQLYGNLSEKIKAAQGIEADVNVEIHFNAFEDPDVGGTEVLYGHNPDDRILAWEIQQRLRGALMLRNRGVKFADYAGTEEIDEMAWPRLIEGTAVQVEPLFLSNPNEAGMLKAPGTHEIIARAVFNGIEAYVWGIGS